jgi:hypothetical protein
MLPYPGYGLGEKDPVPLPMFTLIPEHYNRLAILAETEQPARMELEIRSEVSRSAADSFSFNILAEILGEKYPQDFVMLGCH